MAFIFQFVNVVYYIDWFVDIEESLHPWDKAHLVMMYDLKKGNFKNKVIHWKLNDTNKIVRLWQGCHL